MRNIVFTQLIILFALALFGQTNETHDMPTVADSIKNISTEEQKPFVFVEKMPEFPGGESELMRFIMKNKVYPEFEKNNKIEGTVVVSIVILEDGTIGNIEFMRKLTEGLANEVERIVKLMPKFTPGMQDGKPVKVLMIYHLDFV